VEVSNNQNLEKIDMKTKFLRLSSIPIWILVSAQIMLPIHLQAQTTTQRLKLSKLPPLVKSSVPPNVFYTLDDSGSMISELLPETIRPFGDDRDKMTIASRYKRLNESGETTGSWISDSNGWVRDSNDAYCSPNIDGRYYEDGCRVNFLFPRLDVNKKNSTAGNVYNASGLGDYSERNSVVVGFKDSITVARLRTASINSAYYDPSILYQPWVDPATITTMNPYGSLMAPADPKKTLYNPVPIKGSSTKTIDLTNQKNSSWAPWLNESADNVEEGEQEYFPAVYYVYTPRSRYSEQLDGTCTTSKLNCFMRVEIKEGTVLSKKNNSRIDCKGEVCSIQEEMQNFANWFQYYRSRINIARAGTALAFAKQGEGLRVGFGTINTEAPSKKSIGTKILGVSDDFRAPAKVDFLNSLYKHPIPKAGTPLRRAMDDIGQYFMIQDDTGPWFTKELVNGKLAFSKNQITCRQNFNILMTDGYWNGDGASNKNIKGINVDAIDGNKMVSADGGEYTYKAEAPYSDDHKDTLADIAMFYWKNDLRPDWKDAKQKNVPVSEKSMDKAFWQHLVQYTVGLGVKGSLDPKTDLDLLIKGEKKWPVAATNQVDDLWHAAINSRGQFFNAANPVEFADALTSSLNEIAKRSGDAAAVATSNTILGTNTKIYTSTYMTGNWSGRLEQKTLDPITGHIKSTDWNTDDKIPSSEKRLIVTSRADGLGGIDFKFDQLSASNKQIFINAAATYKAPSITTEKITSETTATPSELVDYLRGNQLKEGKPFRPRKPLLGDLVNSDPQYIKEGRDGGYGSLPSNEKGQSSYIKFYNDNAEKRSATVYVGSNDGMLHAFNASDDDADKGKERFAFVPQEVMSKMPLLAKTDYSHEFFVDATPMIADAAIGSDTEKPWRTVLVSGLGAGGKGVFALDVTDPTNFSKDNVLWELGANLPALDDDMGYTFGTPQIGRLKNGKWVAIFGNGYDSTNQKAVLYVVDLLTREVQKIDTNTGSSSQPNGLSTPKILLNTDATINSVYAGDLLGKMWKFDFDNGSDVNPTAKILYDAARPITTQAQLFLHPLGGFLVLFGTGKIFEEMDAKTIDEEALYGVWDKVAGKSGKKVDETQVTSGKLVIQKLSIESIKRSGSLEPTVYYKVTNNTLDWKTNLGWTIPLSLKKGERLVTDPNAFEGQIIFTTLFPSTSTDPCSSDGLTTTLQINPLNGGPLGFPVLDTNGDGKINRSDSLVSGKQTSSTYGTTIVKTGNGNMKFFQAVAKTGELPDKGEDRKGIDGIPTVRLWRQILNVQ
jgi:type IV pilus assembly protein PilY1